MTEHNNPPAYPRNILDHSHGVKTVHESGMSLLDHFAGLAMQALIGAGSTSPEIASTSYYMADAMLKERMKWIK